jgi:hypothetical protein
MTQSNHALVEQHAAQAKAHLAALSAEIQKFASANVDLKNPTPDTLNKLINEQRRLLATGGSYTGTGSANFATAFIWSSTELTLTFDGNVTRKFNGTSWGVGLGGGVSWGAGVFNVPPEELVGNCSFQQNLAAALTQISFWNDRGMVGSFQGGGLGVVASITGGSGEWK